MTSDGYIGASAQVGLVLGERYELNRHLATGGMAQVWEATDRVLHRRVAAKILHPHLATDEGFLVRFQGEAIAAARLSHSSIVAIFDTVESDGFQAIIMELIEGRTLRSVLDQTGRISAADTTEIGLQVSDALDEAHRGGVVHRDIKPSNIILCNDKRIMVTDFGIAKAGEDGDITAVGTLLGTAKYLSPEQVSGYEVDPRSDLYALGVVLYECLAGVAPFQADTDAATALARLHIEQPRVSRTNQSVPPELDALVYRLMERDPADRYQSASQVRIALTGIRPTSVGPASDATVIEKVDWITTGSSPQTGEIPHPENNEAIGFIESEKSWILPALVVIMVVMALLLAGVLLSQPPAIRNVIAPAQSTPTLDVVETTALTQIEEISDQPQIIEARSIDPPPGDGVEGEARLPMVFDGDESTVWRTESYRRANFAGLKEGVGLLLILDGPSLIDRIRISSSSNSWSMLVFVGDSFDEDRQNWGEPVASIVDESNSETVRLDNAIGSQILLWITDPGESEDDDGELIYRFEVEEVEVS